MHDDDDEAKEHKLCGMMIMGWDIAIIFYIMTIQCGAKGSKK